MNNDHDDLRPTDAPLDALLHERFGNESAPDLSEIIAERHARGEGAEVAARLAQHENPVLRGTQRPLLTAALVLLGIGAVVGTVWSVKNAEPGKDATGQHALQQPPVAEQKPLYVARPNENANVEWHADQDPKKNPFEKAQQQNPKQPQETTAANLEISLRVVDQHGGPIQSFEVEVVYVHKLNPLRFGPAVVMKGIKRQPRDFKGNYTTIKGLAPGTFAVIVDDGIHAKSTSTPFVVSGTGKTKVDVRMNRGGEVRGIVLDSEGRPVSGATVTTAAPNDSPFANSPFAEVLKGRRPTLHTEVKVKTNADGLFVIKKLAVGNYALRAEHIEFSPVQLKDVQVTVKPAKPVAIMILRGAVVHGRVAKQGKPQADYLVNVIRDGETDGKLHTARTDNEGKFRITERLPPGSYTIRARAETTGNGNPFEALLQLKKTQHSFTIEKGKAKVEQNIDLK